MACHDDRHDRALRSDHAVVVWLLRGGAAASPGREPVQEEPSPTKILDRRLAGGSLSVEEYGPPSRGARLGCARRPRADDGRGRPMAAGRLTTVVVTLTAGGLGVTAVLAPAAPTSSSARAPRLASDRARPGSRASTTRAPAHLRQLRRTGGPRARPPRPLLGGRPAGVHRCTPPAPSRSLAGCPRGGPAQQGGDG